MSKVIAASAVSIDGFISGNDPRDSEGGVGRGLGDAPMLFDWYFDGDVQSEVFGDAFKPSAPLVVLSHGEVPERSEQQTLAHTIEEAIAKARELAGGKDVGLMGGGVVTSALVAGLLDEIVLHQVPILLGGGRPFFGELPEHIDLELTEVVPAPGVTHLRYEVVR